MLKRDAKPQSTVTTILARNPCMGSIALETRTGRVISEDNADTTIHPGNLVQMMGMLILMEKIQAGDLRLSDTITIPAAATAAGGSPFRLRPNERYTVDDLFFGLALESAGDAAAALAIHASGSVDSFVSAMNRRASKLGMKATRFSTLLGAGASGGQEPDMSTVRDLSILARELLKYPDVLRYTSCRERTFREGTLTIRNHNPLLESLKGCDGLAAGVSRIGGFSIVATAVFDGRRVLAIVAGALDRNTRNAMATDLLTKGSAAGNTAGKVPAAANTAPAAFATPARPDVPRSKPPSPAVQITSDTAAGDRAQAFLKDQKLDWGRPIRVLKTPTNWYRVEFRPAEQGRERVLLVNPENGNAEMPGAR